MPANYPHSKVKKEMLDAPIEDRRIKSLDRRDMETLAELLGQLYVGIFTDQDRLKLCELVARLLLEHNDMLIMLGVLFDQLNARFLTTRLPGDKELPSRIESFEDWLRKIAGEENAAQSSGSDSSGSR